MTVSRSNRRVWATALAAMVASMWFAVVAPTTANGAPDTTSPPVTVDDDTDPSDEPVSPSTVVESIDEEPTTVPTEPDDLEAPPDAGVDEAPEETEGTTVVRNTTSPRVRDSGIPVSSILIALGVLAAVGSTTALMARRNVRSDEDQQAIAVEDEPAPSASSTSAATSAAALPFLLELGEALVDAGDAVGHVEAMLRKTASAYGFSDVGVLVLPSVLIISIGSDEALTTELRTGGGRALRLDQIDDVLRLELAAERGEITVPAGRRELARIRSSHPPFRPAVLLAGYIIASVGLALILRGAWLEVVLAAVLGLVVGGLRLATYSQRAAYQAFWPLIAAGASSAVVFATARAVDDLVVFPALVSPLIFFLPGGLLTIGVLELATGHSVSGTSRVAAGAMQLVLLAIGILAGARLVGVPGGDIRSGGEGIVAVLAPWIGIALFGTGVAWFYGARLVTLKWIMIVLYVSYAGQVIGGLVFGSALSAFFGAVAMTPVALFAARQRSGPTPLVTFLPGFWLLVPGALGLEGVTRIIGDDGDLGFEVLVASAVSMVGISLGVLLGLVLSGADPSRPWSIARTS